MKTILVVDDEPTIRELVAAVLQDEGYIVVTAVDGRDGIDVFLRERLDLVLLDVMMPGLDGRAAFLAMRADPELSGVPVIMMSAAVTPEGLDPSISAFLPKPFDLDDLLALVTRLIGGPEATEPQSDVAEREAYGPPEHRRLGPHTRPAAPDLRPKTGAPGALGRDHPDG